MRAVLIIVFVSLCSPIGYADFHGALVRRALVNGVPSNQAVTNDMVKPYVQGTFDQAIYDTDNIFNATGSYFEIPEGFTKARIIAQAVWLGGSVGSRQIVVQRKSFSNTDPDRWEFFSGQPVLNQLATVGTTTDMGFSSAILPVRPGDKFALFYWQNSGQTIDVSGGTGTVFGIELYP